MNLVGIMKDFCQMSSRRMGSRPSNRKNILSRADSAPPRPHALKPGKPADESTFNYWTEDDIPRSRLDLAMPTQLAGIENKGVDKGESGVENAGSKAPGQPKQLGPRIHGLLKKSRAAPARERNTRRRAQCSRRR